MAEILCIKMRNPYENKTLFFRTAYENLFDQYPFAVYSDFYVSGTVLFQRI